MSTLKIRDGDGDIRYVNGTGSGLSALDPFTPTNGAIIPNIATEPKQDTQITLLTTLVGKDFATAANQTAMIALLSALTSGAPDPPTVQALSLSNVPNVYSTKTLPLDLLNFERVSIAVSVTTVADIAVDLLMKTEYSMDNTNWFYEPILGTKNPITLSDKIYKIGSLGALTLNPGASIIEMKRKARYVRFAFAPAANPFIATSSGAITVRIQTF